MPRRACSASGTSTACRRSPRNASSARSCSEPVSRASATTPCTSIPSGPREQRPHALVEGGVGGHHLLERGAAAGEAVPLALQRVRLAAERLGAAPGLVGARASPRRGRPPSSARRASASRPRAWAASRAATTRERSTSSSEVSAASFSRSAAARSALPATDAREFWSVAIFPRSATCDSRPRSCPASASACRAAASATAASAATSSASAAPSSSWSFCTSARRPASVSVRGPTRETSSCSSRAACWARTSFSASCCLQ